MTLTDRYIAAALRSLPADKHQDIGRELRGSIADAVDARIVPSVKTIRQRFNARGKSHGWLDRFFRQIMGLDAKMRQYKDGSKFVRAVVDRAGMEGFNRVWEAPAHLPTEAEIHNPSLWMTRMGL